MNNIKKIFGAPGCGKTTRLLNILEKELKEHDPDKIAFVSFTRKGSYEGRDRAVDKFNYRKEELKYFRTLHSIAFRECGFSKYDLISKKEYKTFSNIIGMKFTGYYTEDFFHNDDRYLFLDFLKRNNYVMSKRYLYNLDVRKLKFVSHNYKRFKEYSKIFDFTDMIQIFIDQNKPLPIEVAIIDEAQDLTTLQWKMCEIAFRNCKKVYVAGDDDQAIYEWSGADVNYFIGLKGDSTVLERSYRLPKSILEFSRHISNNIKKRIEKDFDSIKEEGEIHFYNTIDELKLKENETYYFLSRNNWFLNIYRNYLKKRARVFMNKNEFSVDLRHINAINTFEKMRRNKSISDEAAITISPYLKLKELDLKLPWFHNFNFDNDLIAYYKDLIKNRVDLTNHNLMVNTIHGVKGGETDNVVLLLNFTKAVRNNLEVNPDSELRCLYVACTRAKKTLHLIHSDNRNGYDDYYNFEEYANDQN